MEHLHRASELALKKLNPCLELYTKHALQSSSCLATRLPNVVPVKSILIAAQVSPFSLVGCKEQKQKIQIKGKAKQIGF